jgi:tetratricopeptide (TPR) repeat protein
VQIYQRVLAGGRLKGSCERYAARALVSLGRVLAASGQAREAERHYCKAVDLLERLVEEWPEAALCRVNLAQTLAGLANLLQGPGRRQEAEEVRRRVIHHYQTLTANFPEEPRYRLNLVHSYLERVRLLWELGRQAEAAEPYRKALELSPEDAAVNNQLAWFLATRAPLCLRDAALAVRLAKKAVASRPKSGEYRNTLAVAHYRNGDDRGAVAELEAAMRLRAGGDSFDWFFLAMAHARLGDHDQARTWFDRAVQWMDKHRPHNGELRQFRAEAEDLLAEGRKR